MSGEEEQEVGTGWLRYEAAPDLKVGDVLEIPGGIRWEVVGFEDGGRVVRLRELQEPGGSFE